MNKQTYWGEIFWSARREAVSQCATRICGLLTDLAAVDPSLDHFHIVAESGEVRSVGSARHKRLIEALEAGVNRNDVDGSPIEELGYSLRLSNENTRIQALVGCYSEWVWNNFLLGPIDSQAIPQLCQYSAMRAVVQTIVEWLDPEHGVVTSEEFDELIYDYDDPAFVMKPGQYRSGWMTYVSNRHSPIPEVPAGVEVNTIPNRGILIVVTREPFNAAIPDHVRAGNALQQIFKKNV